MAVDPKELLARNKVLAGAYALALLPVILFFVLVSGVKQKFETEKNKLRSASGQAKDLAARAGGSDPSNPVYTQTDVDRFKARKELYQKELDALGGIVNAADQRLERWFDAFKDTKGAPNAADYVTEYNKQIGLLTEQYKAIVTSPTGETLVYNEPPTGNALQDYQKRFWVQQALLEALSDAQKGNDGGPIQLKEKIDFPAPTPTFNPTSGAQAPPKPFTSIPARVVVLAPFPRIAAIVREVLARDIPMRVSGLRVDKEAFAFDASDPRFAFYDQAKPRFAIDGRDYCFEQDAYTANLTDPNQYVSQEHWIPEPRVKVELSVEVYDFKEIKPPAPAEGDAAPDTQGH
jgi:hypothetical protein